MVRVPQILLPVIIFLPVPAIAWAYKSYKDTLQQAPMPPAPVAKVGLFDVLTAEKRSSIWFSYAREVSSVMDRLQGHEVSTLIVPVNSAVQALPHKPHQRLSSSAPVGEKLSIEDQDAQSEANTKRWVESLVIPGTVNLSSASPSVYTTLSGFKLAFDPPKSRLDGWSITSETGTVDGGHVVGVLEGSNGKVLLVDGCVQI